MGVRPELLIRDANGIPMPPMEITQRIKQKIDDALDLRYLSASWAITWRWPAEDPRWATVQSGETDPAFAFDIVGYLPITCSLDEAPAYLERSLRECSRDEVRKMVDRVATWNVIDQPKHLVEEVVEATRDVMGKGDEITSGLFAVTPAKRSNKKAKVPEPTG